MEQKAQYLFETAWSHKGKYYERVFNTQTNQSIMREVPGITEYYVPSDDSQFKYILDETVSLKKMTSTKYLKQDDLKGTYGLTRPDIRNIRDNYWSLKDPKYNQDPNIWFLDIETTALHGGIDTSAVREEVVLIQIYDTSKKKVFVLGSKEWKNKASYTSKYDVEVLYKNCTDEIEIFDTFFQMINKLKPLLVVGWNALGFDYPYLFNRAAKLGLDTNKFSPFGRECELKEKVLPNNSIYNEMICPGIHYMDYMEIYKKFTRETRSSYSLNNIAYVELGKTKINHNMYSSFDGFRTGKTYLMPSVPLTIDENSSEDDIFEYEMYQLQLKYKSNPSAELEEEIASKANDLFVHYGVVDAILLKELDEKLLLTKILLMISSKMGCLVSESIKTVKPWASYINNVAYLENKILPNDNGFDEETSEDSIVGGYVADPQVGKQRWIISVDINSAYPNLAMRGFNMSPETYIYTENLPESLKDINIKHFKNQNEDARVEMLNSNKEFFNTYSSALKDHNISGAVTGACFKRDFKGIIPRLVESVYNDRKAKKKEMLHWKQQAAIKKEKHEDYYHEKYMETQCKTEQLVLKLLMNSLYGAIGNKHFRLFNIEIARAITGNTRFYIKMLSQYLNEGLNKLTDVDYNAIIYNDTDSVVGSTKVRTSQGEIKIEDLFDMIPGTIDIRGEENYIKKPLYNINAASVNDNLSIEFKSIKYIMKHKVKKRMYKITVDGNEVIVTEDHSIMVVRDEKLIPVKPGEILKNDLVIFLSKDTLRLMGTNNFTIEDIGIQEEYVYDIEVEDNHNFFGNNILVHNSCYISIAPFVDAEFNKRYGPHQDTPEIIQEKVDFSDEFVKTYIDPIVQDTNKMFSEMLNAYDSSIIVAEREAISSVGIFVAKKKYLLRIYDMEGVRYNDPDLKMMGIEIIRSSTPKFTRKYLKESIDILLDHEEDQLREWLFDVKDKYLNVPIEDIAKITGIGNLNYSLSEIQYDENGRKISVPINSKSAIVTNNYIQSSEELANRYTQILVNDKVKFLYLREPNPLGANTFAFIDNEFGELFREFVDFDLNWEKSFMKPLEILIKPLNWNMSASSSLDGW